MPSLSRKKLQTERIGGSEIRPVWLCAVGRRAYFLGGGGG